MVWTGGTGGGRVGHACAVVHVNAAGAHGIPGVDGCGAVWRGVWRVGRGRACHLPRAFSPPCVEEVRTCA
eukprot:131726-Chlamydomonas_euryale.AAC.1